MDFPKPFYLGRLSLLLVILLFATLPLVSCQSPADLLQQDDAADLAFKAENAVRCHTHFISGDSLRNIDHVDTETGVHTVAIPLHPRLGGRLVRQALVDISIERLAWAPVEIDRCTNTKHVYDEVSYAWGDESTTDNHLAPLPFSQYPLKCAIKGDQTYGISENSIYRWGEESRVVVDGTVFQPHYSAPRSGGMSAIYSELAELPATLPSYPLRIKYRSNSYYPLKEMVVRKCTRDVISSDNDPAIYTDSEVQLPAGIYTKDATPKNVWPTRDCVTLMQNGMCRAWFGYVNPHREPVIIEYSHDTNENRVISPENTHSEDKIPTVFRPGVQLRAWQAIWPCRNKYLAGKETRSASYRSKNVGSPGDAHRSGMAFEHEEPEADFVWILNGTVATATMHSRMCLDSLPEDIRAPASIDDKREQIAAQFRYRGGVGDPIRLAGSRSLLSLHNMDTGVLQEMLAPCKECVFCVNREMQQSSLKDIYPETVKAVTELPPNQGARVLELVLTEISVQYNVHRCPPRKFGSANSTVDLIVSVEAIHDTDMAGGKLVGTQRITVVCLPEHVNKTLRLSFGLSSRSHFKLSSDPRVLEAGLIHRGDMIGSWKLELLETPGTSIRVVHWFELGATSGHVKEEHSSVIVRVCWDRAPAPLGAIRDTENGLLNENQVITQKSTHRTVSRVRALLSFEDNATSLPATTTAPYTPPPGHALPSDPETPGQSSSHWRFGEDWPVGWWVGWLVLGLFLVVMLILFVACICLSAPNEPLEYEPVGTNGAVTTSTGDTDNSFTLVSITLNSPPSVQTKKPYTTETRTAAYTASTSTEGAIVVASTRQGDDLGTNRAFQL